MLSYNQHLHDLRCTALQKGHVTLIRLTYVLANYQSLSDGVSFRILSRILLITARISKNPSGIVDYQMGAYTEHQGSLEEGCLPLPPRQGGL